MNGKPSIPGWGGGWGQQAHLHSCTTLCLPFNRPAQGRFLSSPCCRLPWFPPLNCLLHGHSLPFLFRPDSPFSASFCSNCSPQPPGGAQPQRNLLESHPEERGGVAVMEENGSYWTSPLHHPSEGAKTSFIGNLQKGSSSLV